MIIETEDENLMLLYSEGQVNSKEYKHISKEVVKGFVKAVNYLKWAKNINEVMRIGGLHYKRLKGNLSAYESVRCNDRWRLLFTSYADKGETIITNVKLIKLSDHYDDL
ncbi:type II toxin-antitoxin system RelE/ParE family toxin [bacterium]|nr:type II toxin-antitoxin system RelE/ParE family toxin [bacterium]